MSGSGAFISRSMTDEGSVHHELTPACRDRLTDRAPLHDGAIRGGLERHGECMAQLRRVRGTKPVGNGTNPSPGTRRLMKAPSRSTLSPGRGLYYRDFVRSVLAEKGGSCCYRIRNLKEQSENVYENKGAAEKSITPGPSLSKEGNRMHPSSDEEGWRWWDFATFAYFAPLRETGFVTWKNRRTNRECR